MRYLLLCLMAGLLLSAQSCTVTLTDRSHGHGGPPEHAPAHGYRARHAYVYYPSSYVYFDTTRKVYFYMAGGTWKMNVSLPSSITINSREGVSMEMDTDRPYIHLDTHRKKYPPGQIKKRRTHGHTKKEQPPGKVKETGKGKGKGKKK